MTEIEIYRNYRLEIQPLGAGFRVVIYPPKGIMGLKHIPFSLKPAEREGVVAQARAIVDQHILNSN